VAVEKLKRGDQVMDSTPQTIIQTGDIVALVGYRGQFLKSEEHLGSEVDDRDVLDLIGEILEICVTKPEAVGQTLGQISEAHGHGCFLRRITRQGHELPLARDLVVHKCDVLLVTGAQKDVEKLVTYLGYPERPTTATDLIFVGLGCVCGTLLGLLAVPVAGIPLTLGIGGGVLVAERPEVDGPTIAGAEEPADPEGPAMVGEDPQVARDVEIARLLAQAERAMDRNRLTVPAGDNAYGHYRAALRLDPGNPEARAGVRGIVTRYQGLAQQRLRKGDLSGARRFAARGLAISPRDPRLVAIKKKATRPKGVKPEQESPALLARLGSWLSSGRSDHSLFLDP
jgi:hypothetical protein